MSYYFITPALVVRALRQRSRGETPCLPDLDLELLHAINGGYLRRPTKAEDARARRLEIRNRRVNEELARA